MGSSTRCVASAVIATVWIKRHIFVSKMFVGAVNLAFTLGYKLFRVDATYPNLSPLERKL